MRGPIKVLADSLGEFDNVTFRWVDGIDGPEPCFDVRKDSGTPIRAIKQFVTFVENGLSIPCRFGGYDWCLDEDGEGITVYSSQHNMFKNAFKDKNRKMPIIVR